MDHIYSPSCCSEFKHHITNKDITNKNQYELSGFEETLLIYMIYRLLFTKNIIHTLNDKQKLKYENNVSWFAVE